MPSTSVRAGPAYSTPIVAAAHAAMSPGSAQGSSSSSAGPRQLTPDEDEDEDDREDMLGGDGEAYELREDIDWEKKRSRHGRGGQRRRRTSGDAANGGGDHEGDDAEGDGVGEVRKESDDEGKSSESESEADDEEGAWDPRSRRGFGRGPRRRPSVASTVMSFQLYTPDEERRVVRKFDRRLVLFVALLYMLSFLDRSNIGNARIAGMDRDLQSRPPRDDWYEWSLTAFYISYIGFEWMSLLWRVIPAHIYVSLLVLSWGLTASLQAVAPSYPFLIFLRTVLGIGEAGFTGIPFYLSFFYRREELALRTAMFISAAPLATSFASSLAYLIIRVGTAARIPIAPWRLLFLVEGFPSVLAAAAAWIIIPDSPRKARYLTRRERRVAKLRLRHQVAGPQPPPASAHRRPIQAGRVLKSYFSGSLVRSLRVLGDPFAWTTAIMLFLANVAYSSLPVFLPTILTSAMHLSSLHAQALAAPPYLIAFVVVLATAFWSDRARARAPFIVAHALLSAAGYAILALASTLRIPLWLRYAAVFPAASGFFAVVVLVISWNVNNIGVAGAARDAERLSSRTETGRREADSAAGTEKGLGFALLQLVGQCGPLVGTHLYPEADASSGYEKGMAVCCAAMLLVALLAVVGRALLVRRNTRLRSLEGEDDVDGDEAAGLVAGGRSRASDTRRGYGFTYIV